MKSLLFVLLCVFTLPTYATDAVKVNKVVAEILNKIVSSDDFVDSLAIVLDSEKTDLNKPSIGVSVEASTKAAAWSVETTSLVATFNVDSEPVDPMQTEVSADLQVKLKTNVYKLSKYAASKDLCSVFTFEPGKESPACTTLVKELAEAKTFKEQVVSVSKAFTNFKVEIKERISVLEKSKGEANDSDLIYVESDLESMKEALKIFEAVKFIEKEGGIVVSAEYEDVFGESDLDIRAKVNESSVSVTLAFSLVMHNDDLTGFMSIPVNILNILESDTDESKEFISSFAIGYIEILKSIVTEE